MVKMPAVIAAMLVVLTSTVTAALGSEDEKPSMADVYLEINLVPEEVLAESEALLHIKLYLSGDVQQGWLHKPELGGVEVTTHHLPEETRHIIVDGRPLTLVEYRTLLYPQRGGDLTVGPATFEGVIMTPPGRSLNPFAPTQKPIEIHSQPLEVKILPSPCDGREAPCLVARSVTVEERFSPESKQLKPGTAITHTLELRAEGLPARLLPSLKERLPGNEGIYPDQPLLEDREGAAGLVGVREEKTAILPSAPGSLRLAPFELTWWNTQKHQYETIRLGERVLKIAPEPEMDKNPIPFLTADVRWHLWFALLVIVVVTTVLLFFLKSRGSSFIGSFFAVHRQRMRARRRLRDACYRHHPQQVKTALLDWAATFSNSHPPKNLQSVARLWPSLREPVAKLNEALYSGRDTLWNGHEFWRTLKTASKKTCRAKLMSILFT